MWEYNYANELYHHGVKGMRWGVRRYQNEDGSLTKAGKKRYGSLNATPWYEDNGPAVLPNGKLSTGRTRKEYFDER